MGAKIKATSVQNYIDRIENLAKNYECSYTHFIFRGHSNHEKYALIPGIFRSKQIDEGAFQREFSYYEHKILYDFISEACRYGKEVAVDDIPAWLEIAQHFGVPTRLLDFTRNPLVALYFACIDSPGEDASVWVLNMYRYNAVFFYEYKDLDINIKIVEKCKSQIVKNEIENQFHRLPDGLAGCIQFPLIYKPYYREERMNAQESVFMLWGSKTNDLVQMMKKGHFMTTGRKISNRREGLICPIIIPHDYKKSILKQLDMCGINEKTIYPGIEGIGRYIRSKNSLPIFDGLVLKVQKGK